jgi:O-antigen/teichoic acid export membrane protein
VAARVKRGIPKALRIRFVRDVALTGGAQVLYAAATMIGGVLVARVLGPGGRGALSVLTAVGSMAVLLLTLGLHTSSIYFLGRFKEDRDTVITNTLIAATVGGIGTAVLLALTGLAFHDVLVPGIALNLFLVFVLSVPFNYFNEFGSRTALGIGRVALMNTALFTGGGGLLAGTAAIFAIFGAHLMPLLVLRVAIEVITAIIFAIAIWRITRFRFRPSIELMRRQVRYGLRNYASSLLWTFLISGDILMCNYFLGKDETGVYSIAVSVGLPVTILAAAVGTLVFQRVSADDSRANRIVNTNQLLRLLTPVVTAAALGLGLVATWAIPFVYGDDFRPAISALLLLLPGLVALTIETVIMNFLAGEGSPSIVYRAPIAGVVVNFGANVFMIPWLGIDGAAIMSTIGYVLVFAIVLRHYARSTGSQLGDILKLRREDVSRLVGRGSAELDEPKE